MKTTYNYEEIFEDIEGDTEHILMKIPPEICEAQGWNVGDLMSIRVEGTGLVLSKVQVPV